MKKYEHELTKDLTPDNWNDKINLNALSLDDLTTLLGDFKAMEAFSKKVGGFLKETVKARMPEGEDEYVGPVFAVFRNHRVRMGGLNRDLVLEDMGEEWVQAHSNPETEYDEIRLCRVETLEQE